MKTRITQEEAYNFLKTLPEAISNDTYNVFTKQSLHLKQTSDGLKFTFKEEDIPNTHHIKNFRLAYFYKGQDVKTRVPLAVGSMALWTTVFQYMAKVDTHVETYASVPFDVKSLKYIGTTDESQGVSNISSTEELPYRLTHTYFTEQGEEVLFIEDVYGSDKKILCMFKGKKVPLNYLEEDWLVRMSFEGQNKESELSKILAEEEELYRMLEDDYED